MKTIRSLKLERLSWRRPLPAAPEHRAPRTTRTGSQSAGIDSRRIARSPCPLLLLFSIPDISLAENFEKNHASSYGNVERFHRAGGRQRNHKVAALACQVVQAFSFAAEHDAYRRRVIHFGVALVAAFVQANQPVARFLQFLHRSHKVCDF